MPTFKCIACGMNVQTYQPANEIYKPCPACADAAVIQDSGNGIFLCKSCKDFVLIKGWPAADTRTTVTHDKCGGPAHRVG